MTVSVLGRLGVSAVVLTQDHVGPALSAPCTLKPPFDNVWHIKRMDRTCHLCSILNENNTGRRTLTHSPLDQITLPSLCVWQEMGKAGFGVRRQDGGWPE